jgi:hypothetical protein
MWKTAGLSSWTSVTPHPYTLETPHPACRRRPAHANRISAERFRKPLALAQKSEQGHAGVHQTHVMSRCVSRSRRDGPAWCRAEPASDQSRPEARLCSTSNHGPQATNSWLPRPPYPPPSPRRPIATVVARHDVAICRVSLTVTVHRAAFGRRSTLQQGPQLSKRPDSLQKAAKVNANAEEDIRKMSATTRLCRHAEAGPGARAAQPHTHAAIPVALLSFSLPAMHFDLVPGRSASNLPL